jgi:hypothetical protein
MIFYPFGAFEKVDKLAFLLYYLLFFGCLLNPHDFTCLLFL